MKTSILFRRIGFVFVNCLMLVLCSSCDRIISVKSPDGNIVVTFALTEDGAPQFTVEQNGKQVLLPSPMGFVNKDLDMTRGYTRGRIMRKDNNQTWETVWGEEQFIVDNYREMVVALKHESGLNVHVKFRVFNDGFAFRYYSPDITNWPVILDETTAYCFAEEPEVWSIPWRTEYYEGLWTKKPLSELDTVCSPVTLEMADGSYAFLHEAALKDYPAQNLFVNKDEKDLTLRTYLTPWKDEKGQDMQEKAYVSVQLCTPWRFMILTPTLPEMVASRIMLNLNEPCAIYDTEWIHPMKFIGIWWGMHMKTMTWEAGPKHGATTENMKRYLQFAHDHHIGGVLAEGWNLGWEDWKHFSFTEPYPDWNMDELSAFADSLGVAIIGHNETGGNALDYEADLDEIYTYHTAHNIHAIKTGYVSPIIRTKDGLQWNKGQSGVRHYRKVIETAAKYHICIDNHEPVMPTGLQRTWPNLLTQEGVRGQEWNAWSVDGGSPCEHVTVLPFTRIMAGPVDYTPGVFNFANPIIPGTRVHSTLMNQLGLFVCFYSPLQMACDLPENYMLYPDAFRFIEQVPCDWKHSILLDGKIGDFVVFARQDRNSDNWYVGGITDEEARKTTVRLDFLEANKTYTATIYRDADNADWQTNPYAYEIETKQVTQADILELCMAAGGGFAISLEAGE